MIFSQKLCSAASCYLSSAYKRQCNFSIVPTAGTWNETPQPQLQRSASRAEGGGLM